MAIPREDFNIFNQFKFQMINLITLFDLIYIAGFLDGDGAIIAQFVARDDYKWKYQIHLSVQFSQHTKRSIYLSKLKDIIGAGSIRQRVTKTKGYTKLDTNTCISVKLAAVPGPKVQELGRHLGITSSNTQTGGRGVLRASHTAGLEDPLKGIPLPRVVASEARVSDYVITANQSVLALLKQLQPYLRIKQKQADLAITLLEQLPLAKNDKVKFIELVNIVDQIASLNDSKVSKRTVTGDFVKEALKNIK